MVAGGSGVKSWADGDMVSGGCYLPWPSELWGPDVPVKTTDKKKKKKSRHCIAACLGGAQREILQGATSGHGHHSSYCLSSEQSAICTPSLPVQMCSMPSGLKCQELFYQTLR